MTSQAAGPPLACESNDAHAVIWTCQRPPGQPQQRCYGSQSPHGEGMGHVPRLTPVGVIATGYPRRPHDATSCGHVTALHPGTQACPGQIHVARRPQAQALAPAVRHVCVGAGGFVAAGGGASVSTAAVGVCPRHWRLRHPFQTRRHRTRRPLHRSLSCAQLERPWDEGWQASTPGRGVRVDLQQARHPHHCVPL